MGNGPGVAIVGLGRWGQTLVRSVVAHGGFGPVWVFDPVADRRSMVCAQHPSVHPVGSIEEVLNHAAIEAVVLATPIPTHAYLGLQVLKAHKHLLVEKPMATSVAEAQAMVDAARLGARTLLVGFTPLYDPAAHWVRQVLRRTSLGGLKAVTTVRNNLADPTAQHPNTLDAVTWDLLVHDLALVASWQQADGQEQAVEARPPRLTSVECVEWNARDDQARCVLRVNDVGIHMIAGRSRRRIRTVRLDGDRGSIEWSETERQRHLQLIGSDGRRSIPVSCEEPLQRQLSDFVSCLRNGAQPLSDGLVGLTVTSWANAILSADKHA